MIGDIIEGKYRIDRRIGKGGFAEVYRARALNLKIDLAVKILTDSGFQGSFRSRFIREIETMARLNHGNIARVYSSGEHRGQPYLVLEMVDGPSLWDLLQSAELELVQVIDFAVQVCAGMAYAHAHGVIHGDLSLKNILITPRDEIKLVDFGLAKMIYSEIPEDSARIGVYYYAAPEQLTGNQIDQRIDVFAFGVCLFRMVNGCFPFEAEHPASVMYKIVNENDVRFMTQVPRELEQVIRKCLEKNPKDRYSDFGDIQAELQELVPSAHRSKISLPKSRFSSARSSKRNPYLNRVMIKNPRDFFGRSREIKRIYSRLDAPHPQSISVVGERRIGKSSLLNYIYDRGNRRRYMQNHDDAIFAYMDFQRSLDPTVPKFIDFLFSMFEYEQKREMTQVEGEKTLDKLKEVIQRIDASGCRVIILMDEFETITNNKTFDPQFFSFLRFLANNYKVAYVTSSYRDLQELCHHKEISDSPFFNIFSNLPLRCLSPDEATALIVEPSSREGVPLERYIPELIDMAGYFPLYLQIACSNTFEYLVENRLSEPDWDVIRECFREEVYPHYAFVWEKIDDGARATLSHVAAGEKIGRKYRYIGDELLRRGYLKYPGEEPLLFSSTFTDFVMERQHGGFRRGSSISRLWGKLRGKSA
jgi:serine/threonine protein kinase